MSTTPRIYIATGLPNMAAQQTLASALRHHGVELTYDWAEHGPVGHLGIAACAEVSENEINGVIDADLVVVLLPGGRGTHAELGAALATGRDIIIHCEPHQALELGMLGGGNTCAFYHHPSVGMHIGTKGELLPVILRRLNVEARPA